MESKSDSNGVLDRKLGKLESKVRELRCLFQLTALINDRELPLDALLQRVVDLIPQAYQYPEIACAHIECGNRVVETPNFRETEWEQTATISTLISRIGNLKVCYLEPRTEEAEGPFLEEERDLINTVGELLGERIDRMRIEEALRLNEERLTMVLNSAPIILWAADRQGAITLARGKILANFGLKQEELVGQSIYSVIADPLQFQECFRRALSGEEIHTDLELKGSMFQSRLAPILGNDGAAEGIIGVQMDITERVFAERELQRTNELLEEVFAGTHFLIAYFGQELRYNRVNRAFARANGHEPDYYLGKKHFDLFPDPELERIFRHVLETREPYAAQDASLKSFGITATSNWDIDLLPIGRRSPAVEGLVLILVDRTRRKRALAELESSRRELERLTSHLQDLREEERKYIAREIHDELGGLLTAIKMDLSLIKQGIGSSSSGSESTIGRAENLANQAIAMVRRIAYDLRPQVLDDLGLVPAFEWLVSEFQKRAKIRCRLRVPREDIPVPKDTATALFRLVQEALTNVARHAQASSVTIEVQTSGDTLQLAVADDGKGITEAQISHPNSFGLIGIQERVTHFGGAVQVCGVPNKGTTLTVTIPLQQGAG